MLDLKKENTNNKDNPEITEEENVTIHTMQEDKDALSGIFYDNKITVKEEEKIANPKEEKTETKNGQYFNPFLENQMQNEKGKTTDFSNKNSISEKNAPEKQGPQEQGNIKLKSSSKKLVWAILVVLIVAIFASGGYYFFSKRNSAKIELEKLEAQKSKEAENQKSENDNVVVETEPLLKYSPDKPNYLSIDTENPSYENFKEVISKALLDIKKDGINKPVEFVITDSKNNPIAFSIFSVITKIKLSNELFKSLNDDFSILAYYDSENPRLILSVKTSDKLKASSLIKNEENKLPVELASLFLSEVSLPKGSIVFKDANYKGVDIRYFNFTPDHMASIDYAFNGDKLIFGTSKRSMWAVLDRVLNEGE